MKEKAIGFCVTIIGLVGSFSSWFELEDPYRIIVLILSIIVILIGLCEFISSRWHIIPYLQRPKVSLMKEIEKSKKVWFCIHTGSVTLAEGGLFQDNKKFKIILTRPECSAMNEIGKVANNGIDKLNSDVKEFTKIVLENKQEIKWFDGFLGSSIILSDPDEKAAWVRVESFLPKLGASFRPSIKFYKKYNEMEFLRIKELFELLWNDSVDPIN